MKCTGVVLHSAPDFHVPCFLSSWNEVLVEKLIVAQLTKRFLQSSVPCLQGSSIGPYVELNESHPYLLCYQLTFK
jgi:hypothetical protein